MRIKFSLSSVLCALTAATIIPVFNPAQAVDVIGFGQRQFRNTSGADANDFHVEFEVPTLVLGQDIQTGDPSVPLGGGGGTTLNFALDPPVGNNGRFQITYAPGSVPFLFNNVITAYFTSGGSPVTTGSVSLWDSFFSFVPNTSSSTQASINFLNQGTSALIVADLMAFTDIPASSFTFEDFASNAAIAGGTPVSIPSSIVVLPGGATFDLGSLLLGNFALVTGTVSRDGETLPFAFAAQAIPEPTTLILFGAGVVALLFVGRHSRRRTSDLPIV